MHRTLLVGRSSPRKLADSDTPKAPYCRRLTTKGRQPTDAGADDHRWRPYRQPVGLQDWLIGRPMSIPISALKQPQTTRRIDMADVGGPLVPTADLVQIRRFSRSASR